MIVTWTKGSLGLNVLSRFGQETALDLNHKTFIATSEKSFGSVEEIAKSAAEILKPDLFLLTREDSLDTIVELKNTEKVISSLKNSHLDYRLIGEEEAQKVTKIKEKTDK